jgi:hypothetical protein
MRQTSTQSPKFFVAEFDDFLSTASGRSCVIGLREDLKRKAVANSHFFNTSSRLLQKAYLELFLATLREVMRQKETLGYVPQQILEPLPRLAFARR